MLGEERCLGRGGCCAPDGVQSFINLTYNLLMRIAGLGSVGGSQFPYGPSLWGPWGLGSVGYYIAASDDVM